MTDAAGPRGPTDPSTPLKVQCSRNKLRQAKSSAMMTDAAGPRGPTDQSSPLRDQCSQNKLRQVKSPAMMTDAAVHHVKMIVVER